MSTPKTIVFSIGAKRRSSWARWVANNYVQSGRVIARSNCGVEYRLLANDEYAYVAMPERALLHLVHFRPQGDSRAYLESVRLQNLESLDIKRLHRLARRAGKPKLQRAANIIEVIARREVEEYEPL